MYAHVAYVQVRLYVLSDSKLYEIYSLAIISQAVFSF